jgi:carbamoyl-phosphate synthase large subunit
MQPDLSAACQIADIAVTAPPARSPAFVEATLAVCKEHGVSLLVPTIDTELAALSNAREQFASIGTLVAVSALPVVQLARDKLATASWMRSAGLCSPASAPLRAVRSDPARVGWPAIIRPLDGSSSKGLYSARSIQDLQDHGAAEQTYFAQTQIFGVEYTVSIFFDQSGVLRGVVPHRRIEVRSGEVSKGETDRHPALMEAGEKIGRKLEGARGVLCFQAILTEDGDAFVFEINARFGGGYPLAQRAGAPFAKWLLQESLGQPVDYTFAWRSGVRMLRYDAAVFTS